MKSARVHEMNCPISRLLLSYRHKIKGSAVLIDFIRWTIWREGASRGVLGKTRFSFSGVRPTKQGRRMLEAAKSLPMNLVNEYVRTPNVSRNAGGHRQRTNAEVDADG
jgi:hypothetical protein